MEVNRSNSDFDDEKSGVSPKRKYFYQADYPDNNLRQALKSDHLSQTFVKKQASPVYLPSCPSNSDFPKKIFRLDVLPPIPFFFFCVCDNRFPKT